MRATRYLANIYFSENAEKATTQYGPIEDWDVSQVTDMHKIFVDVGNRWKPLLGASDFNADISKWQTGNVVTMESMFYQASSFNKPIGNWNTAKVANMERMFDGASSFNQYIGSWNTASVATMAYMFSGATAFNKPLASWNTSSVITMAGMFHVATAFNQPIGAWNVVSVTTMKDMFCSAVAFDQSLIYWNTSSVTTMADMFSGATSFDQHPGDWTGKIAHPKLWRQCQANVGAGHGSHTDAELLQKDANAQAGFGAFTDATVATQQQDNMDAGHGDYTDTELQAQRQANLAAGFGEVTDAEVADAKMAEWSKGVGGRKSSGFALAIAREGQIIREERRASQKGGPARNRRRNRRFRGNAAERMKTIKDVYGADVDSVLRQHGDSSTIFENLLNMAPSDSTLACATFSRLIATEKDVKAENERNNANMAALDSIDRRSRLAEASAAMGRHRQAYDKVFKQWVAKVFFRLQAAHAGVESAVAARASWLPDEAESWLQQANPWRGEGIKPNSKRCVLPTANFPRVLADPALTASSTRVPLRGLPICLRLYHGPRVGPRAGTWPASSAPLAGTPRPRRSPSSARSAPASPPRSAPPRSCSPSRPSRPRRGSWRRRSCSTGSSTRSG